jgi:hypothetical protein
MEVAATQERNLYALSCDPSSNESIVLEYNSDRTFRMSDLQLDESNFTDAGITSVSASNIHLYNKEDYIETLTGNRVSRKSILCGSQNIRLAGKVLIIHLK